MSRALIDTSARIEYLRGTGSAVASMVEERLLSNEALVCDLVLVELWNGARGEPERKGLRSLQAAVECLPTETERRQ